MFALYSLSFHVVSFVKNFTNTDSHPPQVFFVPFRVESSFVMEVGSYIGVSCEMGS